MFGRARVICVLSLALTVCLFSDWSAGEASRFPDEVWKLVKPKTTNQKVILVDLWASWCGPCQESFPYYEKIYQKWNKKGLSVVGINMDADRSAALDFMKHHPISFPVIFDDNRKVRDILQVQTLPRLYILNSDGQVRKLIRGFSKNTHEELEAEILPLLQGQK